MTNKLNILWRPLEEWRTVLANLQADFPCVTFEIEEKEKWISLYVVGEKDEEEFSYIPSALIKALYLEGFSINGVSVNIEGNAFMSMNAWFPD